MHKDQPNNQNTKFPWNELFGLKGLWALAVLIGCLVGWKWIDQPLNEYETVAGTVEESFYVSPRYQPAYIQCRIKVSDGTLFQAPCNTLERGSSIAIYKYTKRLTGLHTYVIAPNQ